MTVLNKFFYLFRTLNFQTFYNQLYYLSNSQKAQSENKEMGNNVTAFKQQYQEDHQALEQKIVSNAPSNKYALRLKDVFPELQEKVKNTHKKYQIPQIYQIIKESPIYYIPQKPAVYQGHWLKGFPHGYGRIIYQDLSYYQGLVVNAQPNTFIKQKHHQDALYIFQNGSFYIGEFRNAKFQGKGRLVVLSGKDEVQVVSGEFTNGLPHGNGKQKILISKQDRVDLFDQYFYDGTFVNGVKQGKGKYYENNHLIYEGEFKNGTFHGEGRYINYNQNMFFVGKFQHGNRVSGQLNSINTNIQGWFGQQGTTTGLGYIQMSDNKFFIGSYKNNKAEGQGIIYHKNGRVIQGIWAQGHNKSVNKMYFIQQEQVERIKQQAKKQIKAIVYQKPQIQQIIHPRRNSQSDLEEQTRQRQFGRQGGRSQVVQFQNV